MNIENNMISMLFLNKTLLENFDYFSLSQQLGGARVDPKLIAMTADCSST